MQYRKTAVKLMIYLISVTLMLVFGSCRWNDDYRERKQPQLTELPQASSLNPDSENYVGIEHHRHNGHHKEALPDIDGLSVIPEVNEIH